MKTNYAGILYLALGIGLGLAVGAYTDWIRPQEQRLTVETEPKGLKVQMSDGQSCIAPCTVNHKTNHALTIVVTDEARKQQLERMKNMVPMW